MPNSSKAKSSRPNFLLFITDQHRADFLGCTGHPVLRTPHIDSIAARGTIFDKFYVASPVCQPNRASLMTGRMPSVHDVRSNGIPLSMDAVTFVDLLRVVAPGRQGFLKKGQRLRIPGSSRIAADQSDPKPRLGVDRLRLQLKRFAVLGRRESEVFAIMGAFGVPQVPQEVLFARGRSVRQRNARCLANAANAA